MEITAINHASIDTEHTHHNFEDTEGQTQSTSFLLGEVHTHQYIQGARKSKGLRT
jgi:hypothetical protein